MDEIDFEGETPVYRQLAEILERGIRSGIYPPGRVIPSKAQIRGLYGVSGGTYDRAMNELRAARLIHTVQGKGAFAAPRGEWRT